MQRLTHTIYESDVVDYESAIEEYVEERTRGGWELVSKIPYELQNELLSGKITYYRYCDMLFIKHE